MKYISQEDIRRCIALATDDDGSMPIIYLAELIEDTIAKNAELHNEANSQKEVS